MIARSKEFDAALIAAIPRLQREARMLTRNRTAADDLLQETLCRAMARADTFTLGTDMTAWLITIARNARFSWERDRQTRQRLLLEHSYLGAGLYAITPPSQLHYVMLCEVNRMLRKLSRQHRQIMVLMGANEWTQAEVSPFIGCPVGTIKSRLSRARAELARMVDAEMVSA